MQLKVAQAVAELRRCLRLGLRVCNSRHLLQLFRVLGGDADLGAIAWALGMTPALHWMSVFPRNAAARALIWQ